MHRGRSSCHVLLGREESREMHYSVHTIHSASLYTSSPCQTADSLVLLTSLRVYGGLLLYV